MDIKHIVARVESSPTFLAWHKKNKEFYLVHCFCMVEEGKQAVWHVGYYHPKKDNIVSFVCAEEGIVQSEPEEAFKEQGTILALDLPKVTVSFSEALLQVHGVQKKLYSTHVPSKTLVMLQHLQSGLLWNITVVAKSMSTINIRIDATTGKVESHKLSSIFDLVVKKDE